MLGKSMDFTTKLSVMFCALLLCPGVPASSIKSATLSRACRVILTAWAEKWDCAHSGFEGPQPNSDNWGACV